jgi:perosamine synthetase
MPNINAALGCAQLEQLSTKLASKRELLRRYQAAFIDIEGVSLFLEPKGCQSNYWLQTLVLDKKHSKNLNSILETTNKIGLMTRPVWDPINSLTPYRNSPRMDLSSANLFSKVIINIPSSSGLV